MRSFVENAVRRECVDEDTLFRVQLVATELVTNAVRHAGSPVELSVAWTGDRIRVEARDDSTSRPAPPDDSPQTRHRGMRLVEDLSDSWGVEVPDGSGKVVWCEVPRSHG